MERNAKLMNESGLLRAAVGSISNNKTRVRLLVAIPSVIVLLLSLMAGVFFWSLDSYGWRASSKAGEDFSSWWLVFLAIFLIAGAGIGYALAWSLTRPIQEIIRLSEKVAGGDLTSKVPITRQDEMGELGSSFNFMIESLNHFIDTRNRFILESFSGGLVVTDINGTVTAVNSAAEKLLGLRSATATGKSIREVFATPELSEILKHHERVVWKKETIVDQRLDLKINGERHPITLSFTSMRDSSGNAFGVIINIRDRDEMERFYQNMRNTDRLATMGTFASGLAHEIRNPLGAIKGTAQLLSEDLGNDHPSQPYLQIITKEVNRLDALIREVQAYSQPALEKTPTDMNQLIKEIVSLAEADVRVTEKTFVIEQNLQDLPELMISKNQFRQAVLNILLNAIQAVADHGSIRVTTSYNPGDSRPIELTIANEGPPIPHDIQKQIFEPFFTTKAAGTGLGLPIAYQVAINHGGRLLVECREGWVIFILRMAHCVSQPSQNDNTLTEAIEQGPSVNVT